MLCENFRHMDYGMGRDSDKLCMRSEPSPTLAGPRLATDFVIFSIIKFNAYLRIFKILKTNQQ